MNKKVIYSAMIGGYDNIIPIVVSKDWDCIMFTDTPEENLPKNTGWKFVKADMSLGQNNALVNRWYKMHPHLVFPEYEESIYIDANIAVKSFEFIDSRIEELKKAKIHISMPQHLQRNCIYKEAKGILKCRKDSAESLNRTVEFLRKNGYPEENGLYENNLIFRSHNEKEIINMMDEWWEFINHYSKRDQMSLCYLLWKNKVKSMPFFDKGFSVRNHQDLVLDSSHMANKISQSFSIKLRRVLVNILCCFIFVKEYRQKLRNYLLNYLLGEK